MLGTAAQLTDIEQLNAGMPRWDLAFRHTQVGNISGKVEFAVSPDLLLTRIRLNDTVRQTGAAPDGMATFGMLEPGVAAMQWSKHWISAGTLEQFKAGAEFSCVSATDFLVLTASIDHARLEQLAERLGLNFALRSGLAVYRPPAGNLDAMRWYVRELIGLAAGRGREHRVNDMQALSADLEVLLLDAATVTRLPSGARSRAVVRQRSLDYMHQRLTETISIGAMCTLIGASWRQTDYAFKEAFGLGPKAYHKRLRLKALRYDLLHAATGDLVTQIATRHGFSHFSQLAKDYAVLFGEAPSATLKKSRGHRVMIDAAGPPSTTGPAWRETHPE